ncbi:MAG: hypothetical protein NZM26_02930 [Patescibacteria group bacterium]|nr:hypothetical protein [Patescibacteria group bacterium]
MSYFQSEIFKPECANWLGYKPCTEQKKQGLANCANCAFYQEGQKILQIVNKPYSPEELRTASSVGIVEMGGLGSILRTTAISKGIGKINPNTVIYWFTHKRGAELLKYVPNVTPIDVEAGKFDQSALRVDVLVNFESSNNQVRVVEIVKANTCIAGFALNAQGKFCGVPPYANYLQRLQIDDAFRKANQLTMQQILLESIGLEYSGPEYDIRLNPSNYQKAAEIINNAFNGRNYADVIGLNIGTSRKGVLRRWPPYRFSELIIEVAQSRPEIGILVLSGPEDSDARDEVIQHLGRDKTMENLAVLPNNIEIGNFMAIIHNCKVVVTADTFGFHVAQAFKKPTVVLVGPMPDKELELTNEHSIIIGPKLSCSPCYYSCSQPIKGFCMINISTNEVTNKILNILQTSKPCNAYPTSFR